MPRGQLCESGMYSGDAQENLTVSGDYHSLPLSTIHVVGYVGLGLLIIQLIGQACYAWKLVNQARGTPFFALALFPAAPNVYSHVTSMLIFGAFNLTAPGNVIAEAWLQLISRSLDEYLRQKRQEQIQKSAPLPDLDLAPQFQRPLLKNPL